MAQMYVKTVPINPGIDVYFRTTDSKLGQFHFKFSDHEEAIFQVKEALVRDGEDILKRAFLAVIKGGKNAN